MLIYWTMYSHHLSHQANVSLAASCTGVPLLRKAGLETKGETNQDDISIVDVILYAIQALS
jgi:hypothetical protein